MSSPGSKSSSRSKRPSSISASLSASASRPFFSSMNSRYNGYTRANSTLPEEPENIFGEGQGEEIDLEAGPGSTIFQTPAHDVDSDDEANTRRRQPTSPSAKSQGKRRVAWDAGASELGVLRPNIQKEDRLHGSEDEKEEGAEEEDVPQSFMIEPGRRGVMDPDLSPTPRGTGPRHSKATGNPNSHRSGSGRTHALYATDSGGGVARKLPPEQAPKSSVGQTPPSRQQLHQSQTNPKRSSLKSSQHLPSTSPRTQVVTEDDEYDVPRGRQSRGRRRDESPSLPGPATRSNPRPVMRGLDDHEKALWNWVNVYNLDAFLQEVYWYYDGKGIYSIALSRGLNLLTVGFVIGFSTFLLGCIDYSGLHRHKHSSLSDVIIPHCVSRFSGFTLLFFLLFTAFYVWQIITFVLAVKRLVDMYKFYTHLLKIPDASLPSSYTPADIQTISWSEVVRRIGAIREENPLTAISSAKLHNKNGDNTTTAKLDAHDIANRIMRQENYLIALFNKDLLDLRVRWPKALERFKPEGWDQGTTLTQALEWNLRFCLMEYLFDQQGQVRKVFLKSRHRTVLIEGLRRRFIFMGILNAIFAPFIVLYLVMYSFFRYFEQYHKDPSAIGGRRYTSFAQWKFREFNELPHFFVRRLDESYPLANIYIGQFPNEKMTIIMRFVSFIAGSFAAVLLLATVLDPDLFLNFEITPHRTVFFYLGVCGGILGVARSMIPEENRVFDPEILMSEVITYTHYMPEEWKGELHSKKVHQEFGQLFAMKGLIFAQELVSVMLTPFILWFSLPECAPAIVDFFREFTVHVDGRGYVCSFAEFNFERHGNVKFGAPSGARNQKMVSNEGKMEKSFLNFKAANPDWNPNDPSGSAYLHRIAEYTANNPQAYLRRRHTPTSFNTDHGVYPNINPNDRSVLGMGVGMDGSMLAVPVDRAAEYDQALRQSRLAAVTRRRGGPGGSMILGMSTLLPPGASSMHGGSSGHGVLGVPVQTGAASVYMDMDAAPSAVLGDSQGSIKMQGSGMAASRTDTVIAAEDIAGDGGVASALGGSYDDGTGRGYPRGGEEQEQEEDRPEDGGVLALLAQIYGRREGPAAVI